MTGTCGASVSGVSSSSGAVASRPATRCALYDGISSTRQCGPPVRVHAGHQVVRPVVLDEPGDEVEQSAHGVDRRAVRRAHRVGDPEVGAEVEGSGVEEHQASRHTPIMPHPTDTGPEVNWITLLFGPGKCGQARHRSGSRRNCNSSACQAAEPARSTVCRRGWQTVFGSTREVYVSRLQAEHLYKVFGRRPDQAVQKLESGTDREELRADGTTAAVIDASFTVEPGQIFVVMGLSGSGKSTLIRMLNGLLEPTAGRCSSTART